MNRSADAQGLLLDFGAVISVTAFEVLPLIERRFGLPQDSLRWSGPFDPGSDPLWQSMQRDEISERDYWARRVEEVNRSTGRSMSVREFMIAIYDLPQSQVIRPAALRAVQAAKRAHKRVGLLTNELELFHGRDWMASLEVLQYMDFIIDATHTHILKPDPRAYALAIEEMRLPPHRIVFLDDQRRNVDGALSAGLRALYFDVTRTDAMFETALRWLDCQMIPAGHRP